MPSFSTLQTSDFYTWFHLREVGRKSPLDSLTSVKLKPGAFEESIDLTFTLDADEQVQIAQLDLRRGWLRTPQGFNPMAADIAASFMRTFVVLPDAQPAADIARAIDAVVLRQPGMMMIRRAAPSDAPEPPPPGESAQQIAATYEGTIPQSEVTFPGIWLTTANRDLERNGTPESWWRVRVSTLNLTPDQIARLDLDSPSPTPDDKLGPISLLAKRPDAPSGPRPDAHGIEAIKRHRATRTLPAQDGPAPDVPPTDDES